MWFHGSSLSLVYLQGYLELEKVRVVIVNGLSDDIEGTANTIGYNALKLLTFSSHIKAAMNPEYSGIKDPAVELLVPANPKIHNWNSLASILDFPFPHFFHQASYPLLQFLACQNSLCLIGP